MAAELSEHLCKFQNSGFCKFRAKCHFKHVFEICSENKCDKSKCLKRHPKKCRYHFLKRSCKFKQSCEYSHGQEKEIQDIKLIRLEVEQLKKINKELENDLKALKLANVNLEVNLQNLTEEVDQVKKERDALESQNDSIKEVNDNLIEDLTTLNERLAFMIPGKLEEENLELKEKIAILKCISEMHDVEEIEEPIDEEIETIVESMETETDAYFCELCPLETSSQQGLKIHLGIKHKH